MARLLYLPFWTLFLSSFSTRSFANVAYPGIWTGRQPSGESTGEQQLVIGTPEYSYSVVETDESWYATMRASEEDGTLRYATVSNGRYIPSPYVVGKIDPDDPTIPIYKALVEEPQVIHAKCMESDYCKWKLKKTRNGDYRASAIQQTPMQVSTNLVIPFMFADHEGSREPMTIDDLDSILFNGPELSVQEYFEAQSYGKFKVISEVAASWVVIPYTESECASGVSGLSHSMHQCLEAVLALVDDSINTLLKSGSKNQNFSLTFVHSGYAAEFGGNDADGAWYEDRIWSHAWELDTAHYSGKYALISDKYGRTNRHLNRVGVVVHEIAQVLLGAPTMYGNEYPGYGLGYYDMLANPWGFDGTLVNCGSMSPWVKSLFGWVQLEEITQDGDYQLKRSYDSNKVYVIRTGFPDGEYLILENRQEEGYDKGVSQPGLAIFHVDELASNIGGHPGQANFPQNHYIVAMVQGDGRFDLERMEDEGDTGDLFHAGRFSGVGPDGSFLDDGSLGGEDGFPNTKAYQGGVWKDTGITITKISIPDVATTFTVSFQSA